MHESFKIPNLVLKKKKFSLERGLVKMHVNLLDEGTNLSMHSHFSKIHNEVFLNLNFLKMRVKYQIFSKVYDTSVVTSYQDKSKINIVITDLLFHPDNMWVKTTHNNILCLTYG